MCAPASRSGYFTVKYAHTGTHTGLTTPPLTDRAHTAITHPPSQLIHIATHVYPGTRLSWGWRALPSEPAATVSDLLSSPHS